MTGYTVHTGSNEKFTEGWDRIFSDQQKGKKAGGKKKSTAQAKRKSGRKKKTKK